MDILGEIKRSLRLQYEGIQALLDRVDESCERAVALLHECPGQVAVTGMGKAGLVGRKVASTLASVGVRAVFLHPSEALHGDLGGLRAKDVVMAFSNSGETGELLTLIPHLHQAGVLIIALTGAPRSTLGRQSDVVIDVGVTREADTLGLVPTASSTAALAMGDALAVALMNRRGFTKEQYAGFHPGGALGTFLHASVSGLMIPRERTPLVKTDATMREVIVEVSSRRLGAAFVVGEDGRLEGVVTDGDLRRLVQREENPLDRLAKDIMSKDPRSTRPDVSAVDAMRLMEDHSITVLPVLDEEARPISAIHMHDLVKAGLAAWSSVRE